MRKTWIVLALCAVLVAVLLVSFFVLSTTLARPSKMTLNVPGSKEAEQPIDPGKTLILYLGDQKTYLLDRISPEDANASKSLTMVPNASLSRAVREIKQEAESSLGKDSLILIVKPLHTSSYKTMVDVLDVLASLKIKRYALVDALTDTEKVLLKEE